MQVAGGRSLLAGCRLADGRASPSTAASSIAITCKVLRTRFSERGHLVPAFMGPKEPGQDINAANCVSFVAVSTATATTAHREKSLIHLFGTSKQ